jgi:thioredoxin-related protein
MKKFISGISAFAIIAVMLSFTSPEKTTQTALSEEGSTIKWYTWEEAIKAAETNPKKVFIDVYTDWCGWCKKMDKTTFADPMVAAYLNKNFYPVKFNAEQKEAINYNDNMLKFRSDVGRRGIHELAYALLDGRMSYPSYVYLDEKQDRITISPGFKEAPDFYKELKYITEEHYKTTTYDKYMKAK